MPDQFCPFCPTLVTDGSCPTHGDLTGYKPRESTGLGMQPDDKLPPDAIEDSEWRDRMDEFYNETDFCSRCQEHADFYRAQDNGEWLSMCCDAPPVDVEGP